MIMNLDRVLKNLTLDSPSPLQANAAGKYSIPMPGLVKIASTFELTKSLDRQ